MNADVLLLYLMTIVAFRDVVIKTAYARLDVNVALNHPSYQSSIYDGLTANIANDGSLNNYFTFCAHTNADLNSWWAADLGVQLHVAGVKFTNRGDAHPGTKAYNTVHFSETQDGFYRSSPESGVKIWLEFLNNHRNRFNGNH